MIIANILNPYGISITDWIQAFGAIIAIAGAIFAFVKLFQKDRDKQSQIDSLAKIAEESENQTRQLTYQVEQMNESNKIQSEYLQLFQESLSLTKDKAKLEEETRLLDEKRRKLAIMPRLEFSTSLRALDFYSLDLINKGEKAKILSYEELEKNSVTHSMDNLIKSEISNNQSISITFKPKPFGLSIRECFVEIKLFIEDQDGTKYYQLISGPGSKISINPPVLEE